MASRFHQDGLNSLRAECDTRASCNSQKCSKTQSPGLLCLVIVSSHQLSKGSLRTRQHTQLTPSTQASANPGKRETQWERESGRWQESAHRGQGQSQRHASLPPAHGGQRLSDAAVPGTVAPASAAPGCSPAPSPHHGEAPTEAASASVSQGTQSGFAQHPGQDSPLNHETRMPGADRALVTPSPLVGSPF